MRLSVGHFDFILVGVLSLLNICAYFLPQIWGIFSYYFLNKLSAPVSLSSPSDTAIIQILIYLMVSHKSLRLSSCLYFFFLFVLWPDHFKWPVFKFTDSFFCLIRSALDSPLVKFSVQLSYSSVPEFYLVIFYSFYLFDDILILFMHCFSDFIWLLRSFVAHWTSLIYFEFFVM